MIRKNLQPLSGRTELATKVLCLHFCFSRDMSGVTDFYFPSLDRIATKVKLIRACLKRLCAYVSHAPESRCPHPPFASEELDHASS